MCILGLDIGTSGCKVTIIGQDGAVKKQTLREYALITNIPGHQEINPNEVWEAVKQAVAQAVLEYQGEPVTVIGVTSFGEAVVALDKTGNVLCNSFMYTDTRGQMEAQFLRQKLGDEKMLGITGTSIHPMYSLCKMMWIKQNWPETFALTWKFMLFADYILFRFGAMPHTDYSLAARTMAFDVTRKVWSTDILECAGIDISQLGTPVQSGTLVGLINPEIARDLGLSMNVVLVAGGHDQCCAALGAGVIHKGIAVDGLGTTECITPVFDKPIVSSAMANNGFACVPYVIEDMYATYGFIFTSGSLLTWYRNNFGHALEKEAALTGVNPYELLLKQVTVKPSNLFVLPHFSGAATPFMNPEARGAIVGLTLETTAGEIIKAILEGITFEMMVNVERMEQAGIELNELRAVGGLARSEAYLQLKADMTGKKVTSLQISEAGTLGVAILAGKATNLFASYEEAVKRLVKIKHEYMPNPEYKEGYKERFDRYKRIYPALLTI